MKALIAVAFTQLALAAGGPANAQVLQDYRCKIDRTDSASQPGSTNFEFLRKNYVGKEFTVDRRTGVMVGVLKNAYVTRPQVIDLGSKDNSFKVITTLRLEEGVGQGTSVHVLVVNEWEKPERKTFVFIENQDVYFGHCVHF